MKKHFFFFILMLSCCSAIVASAQKYTLEQLDMSPEGELKQYDTYVTDINNRGFLTGYYTNNLGENVAFIITRKGVQFHLGVEATGSTDSRAVSINDNDIAIIVTKTSGKTTIWKIHVVDEDISELVQVQGVEIDNAEATNINNKNDICGWYQGQNSRWLFVLHDSIVPPGQPKWYASRYMPTATFYDTWGSAVDTNQIACGFYQEGQSYKPYLHNTSNNTYRILSAPTKTKIWDMNNSQTMVGEYQQGNGVYMACYGNVQGISLKTVSLGYIFHSNTIQSVANGINDKGHIVGQFLDPNTKKWKGFIYRPGEGKYGYEKYDFKKHIWSFENNESDEPGDTYMHWNKDFFNTYINYSLFDPYLYDGTPLLDDKAKQLYKVNHIRNNVSPEWKSFCIEEDENYTPMGTAQDKEEYRAIYKYDIMNRWFICQSKGVDDKGQPGAFLGDCYGFAITSLLHYCDSTSLHGRYNLPIGGELFSYSNMDSVAKRAVSRGQLLQLNPTLKEWYWDVPTLWNWDGLYRTKTYMLDTLQKVNIRTISLYLEKDGDTSGHAVFPHHIHTPQKLPFLNPSTGKLESDTVIIYDSNYPTFPGSYFTIRSDRNAVLGGYSSPDYKLVDVEFQKPTFTEIMNTPYAAFKSDKSKGNITATIKKSRFYNFCCSPKTDYTISNNGLQCYQQNNIYKNYIPKLRPEKGSGTKAFRPLYFSTDTAEAYAIQLKQYRDSVMRIIQSSDDVTMSLNRDAKASELDNLSVGKNRISYGNPETIAKSLTSNYTQIGRRNQTKKSVNIILTDIGVASNDSLITMVPADYTYRLLHPKGGDIRYNLDVYVVHENTVKHFSKEKLLLPANTSHTINPYHQSSSGLTVVVYEDKNMDGVSDDTTAIQDAPLNVGEDEQNVDWIKTYPNPATNYIKIHSQNAGAELCSLLLVNTEGRIIHQGMLQSGAEEYTIDLSGNAVGMYYLFVLDSQHQAIYKQQIIKK